MNIDQDNHFQVFPIGFVRNPFSTRSEVPVVGGPAVIEVMPRFVEGLEAIGRASHIIVLAFLHLADRGVLRARPRRVDPAAPLCGVFASRSPDRPNPVSVTVMPLLRVEGNRLHVDHCDLMDGTPVIDIKTYSPGMDCVFCAATVRRARVSATSDELLRAFFVRDLENHVGSEQARSPASKAALDAVLWAVRRFDADARDGAFRVTTNRGGETVDALMALMGATWASGRVQVSDWEGPTRFVFEYAGQRASVTVTPDGQREG